MKNWIRKFIRREMRQIITVEAIDQQISGLVKVNTLKMIQEQMATHSKLFRDGIKKLYDDEKIIFNKWLEGKDGWPAKHKKYHEGLQKQLDERDEFNRQHNKLIEGYLKGFNSLVNKLITG